jgi:hypothetical protein
MEESYQGDTEYEKGRYVINFISATDIPPPEYRKNSCPYLRAYISSYVSETDNEQGTQFKLKRISDLVCTPRRIDCQSVVWNSFRDFRIKPPTDAIMTLEILHSTYDPTKPDSLLGKADIPINRLVDESPVTIPLICFKVRSALSPPPFDL